MAFGVAEVFENAADCVRGADLVIVTTPVDTAEETFLAIAPGLASGAVVTDAGSVKGAILLAARRLPAAESVRGRPSHGRRGKAGATHASAQLFEGRVCFLTPTGAEDPQALAASVASGRNSARSCMRPTPPSTTRSSPRSAMCRTPPLPRSCSP